MKKSSFRIVLILFIAVFVTAVQSLFGQNAQLSPRAELSVITCGPGTEELYASFGHSAFRVFDEVNGIDRVYNYGTFNFNTPNFYLKFAQGKLLYQLSAYDFELFLRGYSFENRWVKGQVLDLSQDEVQLVYDFLENNALPENRDYKYDFFYDNCSTKLYEVLETVLGDRLVFDNDFAEKGYTQRELIGLYTHNQPWGDFGIDLALGSDIDREATAKEYMFLPDYVFDAFTRIRLKEPGAHMEGEEEGEKEGGTGVAQTDEAVNAKLIVKRTEDILLNEDREVDGPLVTPFQAGGIFLVIVLWITFLDHRKMKRNRIFDGILFLATGLIGVFMLLLWFATDHTATANNFNILWAFAPNLIFAFIPQRKPRMSYWYLITLLLLLDVLLVLWVFKIQDFHIAMAPILLGLYVRYVYLWSYFKKWRWLGQTEVTTEEVEVLPKKDDEKK